MANAKLSLLWNLSEPSVGCDAAAQEGRCKLALDAELRDVAHVAALPNSDYAIPERTPVEAAPGTERTVDPSGVPRFGSGSPAIQDTMPRS